MAAIHYRTADVDGFNIFYREAGRPGAPKLLLLHGYPSSGHMFRDLIPLLAERFHIVAPDLPGFGQSDMPSRDTFALTPLPNTGTPSTDCTNDRCRTPATSVYSFRRVRSRT